MRDVAHTTDSVKVELAEYVSPLNPCQMCGKETVQHDPDDPEVRICTGFDCALVQHVPGAKR